MEQITFSDFEKIAIHVGTIIDVKEFPKAKKPAYKLQINFGELGIKKSSAQITVLYKQEELLGKQVIAVLNFPPKQVADFVSECLVLGIYTGLKDEVVLLQPSQAVPNGSIIG